LKYLAKTLLEKEIQTGEGGHDPEEDARTCLELLEMKLKLGKSQFSFSLEEAQETSTLGREGKDPSRRFLS